MRGLQWLLIKGNELLRLVRGIPSREVDEGPGHLLQRVRGILEVLSMGIHSIHELRVAITLRETLALCP